MVFAFLLPSYKLSPTPPIHKLASLCPHIERKNAFFSFYLDTDTPPLPYPLLQILNNNFFFSPLSLACIVLYTDSTHITETDANAEPEYTKRPFHDIPVSEYASTILNNRATKEKLISKYSRYDMMTGVVSADSFFAFSNHDIQYGIEPDRRSKILKTFVKYTYR